jgi:hypothetical protein
MRAPSRIDVLLDVVGCLEAKSCRKFTLVHLVTGDGCQTNPAALERVLSFMLLVPQSLGSDQRSLSAWWSVRQ